jgi:hypothetical protein
MDSALLTPQEAMGLLKVCRKTLAAMAAAGVVKRVNISAGSKQARWRYILDLAPDGEPDAKWLDLKRRMAL